MPHLSTVAPLSLLATALVVLSSCTEPGGYDLRRVPLGRGAVEVLEAGGVARLGERIPQNTRRAGSNITDMAEGSVTVFVAPSADASIGGGVDIELAETGWRSWMPGALRERCTIRWGEPGMPVSAPWQSCTFDLNRPIESARLDLVRCGGTSGEIFVSDVRLEGKTARNLPDVFVLLLDAVRFDGLRPFRADSGVGRNLEALARDSIELYTLHSSSSWTRPAVATLFTGMRADRHRVLDRGDVLADEAVTLAELLRERGYSTAAWSTNPNVLPVWGLAQGFDAFVDQGSQSWVWGKTDGTAIVSVLRAALARRGTAPLFHYAHFMDPHAPYRPSPEQRKTVEVLPGIHASFPRPLAILSSLNDWSAFVDYTGELLDTDDHVGAVIQMLKDAGRYDNSLILVLSDHGEEFIDHGGRDHGRTLYEEVLRIPALLKLPHSRFGGKIITNPSSLVDIMPTLLETLGVEVPAGLDGAPIHIDGDAATAARPSVASLRLDGRRFSAIIDPPWKLIRNDSLGAKELYNLDEDPKERSNLVLWQPDVVTRMTSALDVIMSHGQEGWHVLFCGSLEEATMDLQVTASSGTVQPFGFQDDEAVAVGETPGAWRLRPALAPVTVERPVFGKMAKVVIPEQVELLVSPAGTAEHSTLEIRSSNGEAFDYRAGLAGKPRSSAKVILDSRSSEVASSQGTRVECTPATKPGIVSPPPTQPFVRAWYVAPTPRIAVETLDPSMRERLRALGYLQ